MIDLRRMAANWNALVWLSLVLSLANTVLVFFFWNRISTQDVMTTSMELSMTVVQVTLGVVAILLAVLALSGFWIVRGAAIRAAEEEAARVAEGVAAKVARQFFEKVWETEEAYRRTREDDALQNMMNSLDEDVEDA